MVRSAGRYLVIGQVHTEPLPFNPSLIVLKHLTLIGCLAGAVEHYARGLEFVRDHGHRFGWNDLISSHSRPDAINDAIDGMRAWQEIEPSIDFG